MAMSFDAARRRGTRQAIMAERVLWRAVKLYALGCFLNGGSDLYNWRLLGVLQYFAVSYLCVGLLEVYLSPPPQAAQKSLEEAPPAASAPSSTALLSAVAWREVGRYWQQWAVMALLAAVYLGLQQLLPLPNGCPTGYTGPGGLAEGGAHRLCTGGAHRIVDVALFGESHMYHDTSAGAPVSSATCADVFGCQVYDPEGSMGWISAAWVTFLGLQAGRALVHTRALVASARARGAGAATAAHIEVAGRLAAWGVPLALLGAALAGFRQDGGLVPINKNLWSPSFVLVLAGIDFCCLAALYLVVDAARAWEGAPFVYAGVNSIIIYTASEAFDGLFPFAVYARDGYASHAEHLFSNIFGVCSFLMVARILYLKKIFVNL